MGSCFPLANLWQLGCHGVRCGQVSLVVHAFLVNFSGSILFVSATPFALWAMAVNRFFEWTARIQDDKHQYVCKSGPYRIVRHPGYSGLILSTLAYPLVLGSWWGFVLSSILTVMIVIRTALEDRMLRIKLPGYVEYANQVKYRLIPVIW
jgi:protein-S-isoprenylcysteine O-methyltransferase Ste14